MITPWAAQPSNVPVLEVRMECPGCDLTFDGGPTLDEHRQAAHGFDPEAPVRTWTVTHLIMGEPDMIGWTVTVAGWEAAVKHLRDHLLCVWTVDDVWPGSAEEARAAVARLEVAVPGDFDAEVEIDEYQIRMLIA